MRPQKILVVDDEPQMRRALRLSLNAHDYQVIEARSGEEALQKFDAELILSIRNSEQDKVAALKAVRCAEGFLIAGWLIAAFLLSIMGGSRLKTVQERQQAETAFGSGQRTTRTLRLRLRARSSGTASRSRSLHPTFTGAHHPDVSARTGQPASDSAIRIVI
jgi:CheY-like chemotaxis protein